MAGCQENLFCWAFTDEGLVSGSSPEYPYHNDCWCRGYLRAEVDLTEINTMRMKEVHLT